MSTLNQIREGLTQAWEALTEGWQDLRQKASHALTRFQPQRSEMAEEDNDLLRHAARWGVLAAEVMETDDSIIVKLEAPGMKPEDFDIQVTEDYLVVRGEKRVEREERKGRYFMMERAYGRFERATPLPSAVDENGARAQYRHGVLKVTLPKSARARSRKVEVQVG